MEDPDQSSTLHLFQAHRESYGAAAAIFQTEIT